MRRRRLERLVSRAEEAIARGNTDEVADPLMKSVGWRRAANKSSRWSRRWLRRDLASPRPELRPRRTSTFRLPRPLRSCSRQSTSHPTSWTFRPIYFRPKECWSQSGRDGCGCRPSCVEHLHCPGGTACGLFPSLADNRTAPAKCRKDNRRYLLTSNHLHLPRACGWKPSRLRPCNRGQPTPRRSNRAPQPSLRLRLQARQQSRRRR